MKTKALTNHKCIHVGNQSTSQPAATTLIKCEDGEGCVETFNCHGGYILDNSTSADALAMQIDIRINSNQKACKTNFDGVSYVCCKYLRIHTIASYPDSLPSSSPVEIPAQLNLALQVPAFHNLFSLKTEVNGTATTEISIVSDTIDHQSNIVQRFASPNQQEISSTTTTTSSTLLIEEPTTVKVSQSTNNTDSNNKFSQIIAADILALPEIESTTEVEQKDVNNQIEQFTSMLQNLSLTLLPPTTKENVTGEINNIPQDNVVTTTIKSDTTINLFSENSSLFDTQAPTSQDVVLNMSETLNVSSTTDSVMKTTYIIENSTNDEGKSEPPTVPPKKYDNIKREFKYYPFFNGVGRTSDYIISDETGEKVNIPSQYYEPPSLTPQDLLRLILPPVQVMENDTTDPGEIQLLSPLAGHSDKETCSQGMKCLSEAYCSTLNPDEGDLDAFDIRLQFRKRTTRKKCRQPNLPVDGYCCYLREDFASMSSATPTKQTEEAKKRNEDEVCGIRRPPLSTDQDDSSTTTTFGEFPWQSLILRNDSGSNCSGAIISQRIIVTSATCLKNAKIDNVQIRVGEWDTESNLETKPHQQVTPRALISHPGFKLVNSNLVHDIALVVTKEKIKFDYHVSRICLPEPIDRFEDKRCVATGWTSNEMVQVPLPIISHGMCEMRLRNGMFGQNYRLHRTSICAGGEPKIDSCMVNQGGAPLACENSIGSYTLVGLSSFKCNQTVSEPAIFTNVPVHTDWIYTILQKDPDEFNSF